MSDGRTPTVTIVGEVSKVETFDSAGGGYKITVKAPNDEMEGVHVIDAHRKQIVDISFAFRETYKDLDDDGESPSLFSEEDAGDILE